MLNTLPQTSLITSLKTNSIKMKLIAILSFTLIFTLTSCSSKKKQAELIEMTKPDWLKDRPVSSSYFYGIGTTPKVGSLMFYEEKARESALSDLAKQINTRIKSESNMYRMEDNKGVYEYIQSRIKATSTEFLEGYEYIDKWEDLNNYYAFYRLSKSEFYARKEKRKQDALQLSLLKIKQAADAEENNEIIVAIELYATAIDAISGYLNEETTVDTSNGKLDLFEESKEGLNNLINGLKVDFNKENIIAKHTERIRGGAAILKVTHNDNAAQNIPVRFNYSGSFLVTDKFKTDENGITASPEFTFSNNAQETLKTTIDLVTLGRQVTRNLIVRQLIEKQKSDSAVLTIKKQQ